MKTRYSSIPEIVKFLQSVDSFSKLSENSLLLLARAGKFQHVDKGEILFFQSDPSDCAYLVNNGNISIVLTSPDGREMVINEMHSRDLFGELGILTKKPRSTTAIARSNSELLLISREAFLQVLDHELQLARLLLELTGNPV